VLYALPVVFLFYVLGGKSMNKHVEENFEEENFEELLEQYISDEEIKEKIEAEEEEELEEEQNNHRSQFDESDVISIGAFITDYLGIIPINVNCKRGLDISHASLKQLGYKSVIAVSNEYAEYNLNYVKNRVLLVVQDYRGNYATYINPKYLVGYIDSIEQPEQLKKVSGDVISYACHMHQKTINENMAKVIDATTKTRKVGVLRKEMRKYDKF